MQLQIHAMRFAVRWNAGLALLGLAVLLPLPSQASHFHRGPTSTHGHKTAHAQEGRHSRFSRHAASSAAAGHPRAIDDARATQIQTALVKAGYLETASGRWDDQSAAAMRKLQGDNGWQTKIIPDSRALIKLGLGPGSETLAPVGNATASPMAWSPDPSMTPHGLQ